MTDVINDFSGKYHFLSNFYPAPFMWRGHAFRSGEQAFAFAKCFFMERGSEQTTGWQRILDARTPNEAKKLGRRLAIDVKEWDRNKVQYMREIVHAKFAIAGNAIVGDLINTGDAMLIEGNTWGDKYWGRIKEGGRWVGLNKLGVILMEERGYWLHYGDK